MMEGTSPASFLNMPAMILVFVGTFGVTLAACGMDVVKKIPAYYKIAFAGAEHHLAAKVHELVAFAEKARKDGLLALESDLEEIDDAFTKKGMQLVVDGTDPDLVREILEVEIDAMAAAPQGGRRAVQEGRRLRPDHGHHRHRHRPRPRARSNLSAPETLGPSISGAFIATLIGVGAANVVFLPVADAPEGPVARRAARAQPDPRGHPLHPGRRQPARRVREAHEPRAARRAPVRRGGRQAKPAPRRCSAAADAAEEAA